jgi:CHAD domain-containing protein
MVAEVVDDEVSVLDGRRVAARFREVEVELAGETEDDGVLEAIGARLAGGGVEEPSPHPKFVRALLPRSQEPPEVCPVRVGPRSTVRDVIRASIAASAERMIRHDAGVRLGDDIEAVHQARVATRRLRSDLRTFRSLLDPDWNADLRRELGWLGGELGTVRDLDVLGERLRRELRRLPDEDAPLGPKLLDRVRSEREAARAELTSAMREPRYLTLLDRVVAAAAEPAVIPDIASLRARETMGTLMEGPWSHLERVCSELGPSSMDTDLHQARIRAKRARYAAETLIPVFGKPARRFARRAERLQTILGDHQDAVMMIAWLRGQAGGTTARVAFMAGELAGDLNGAKDDARTAWPPAWKALQRKKLRFWEMR